MYNKQNFTDGEILRAQPLNTMDNKIEELDSLVEDLKENEVKPDDIDQAITDYINSHPNIGNGLTESEIKALIRSYGYYTKPTNGIPKTDLAPTVQTSLNKIDSTIESVDYLVTEKSKITDKTKISYSADGAEIEVPSMADLDVYATKQWVQNQYGTGGGSGTTTGGGYVKPSTGIPKSDLASGVQMSLNKADSALQSIPDIYATKQWVEENGVSSGSVSNIYKISNPKSFPSLMDLTTTQAYALLEEYVNKGLLIKTTIGYASSSNTTPTDATEDTTKPIYMYSFVKKTKGFEGYRTSNLNKAVLVTGALHGNEKIMIPMILTLLADYEAENTKAKWLLDSFEWDFVPIVNPVGFDKAVGTTMANVEQNIGRVNARNVDLNRNGQTLWGLASADEGGFNYKGKASCSECETKAIRNLFNTKDYLFYLDVHSERYNEATQPMFGRILTASSITRSAYTKVVETMYNRIKDVYHQNILANGLAYTTAVGGVPYLMMDFINYTGYNQMAAIFEAPRYVGGALYPEDSQKCCTELIVNYLISILEFMPGYLYSRQYQDNAVKAGMLLNGDLGLINASNFRYGTYNDTGISNDWSYKRAYSSTPITLDPGKTYEIKVLTNDGSTIEVSTECRDNDVHKSWKGWATLNTVDTTEYTKPTIHVTFRKKIDGEEQNIVLTDIGSVYFLSVKATS